MSDEGRRDVFAERIQHEGGVFPGLDLIDEIERDAVGLVEEDRVLLDGVRNIVVGTFLMSLST